MDNKKEVVSIDSMEFVRDADGHVFPLNNNEWE